MRNWKVISISTNSLRVSEDLEVNLTYNEARTMAKDWNESNHFGEVFEAVKCL